MKHEGVIKSFLISEFMPDVTASELANDYDLLANGVIDSLGLLKLIAWIETEFDVTVDDAALDPDNFRTVDAIDAFLARTSVLAKAS
ncbi:phosphopantetheine-binding protein [Solwaraspora sp. WMMD406]|uniref:phosphopantetheine-binding protein n=1 Tax=Solwaraspora sp. WMMD406 TaxID=3016095 RepID=UPI002417C12F|nr:phosphopantetheine-binding protein [Solwaraspora sp. WMMD406]MDG4762658.1 phosphopantetheine-binding protein [Solwaraspora sp. WMMD406]